VCSIKDNKLFIGLSGNPAAAMITFELLVKPLIHRSFGLSHLPKVVKGKLMKGFSKVRNQMCFLRAYSYLEDGEILTELTGMQNPGVMKSILTSNSLIIIPAGVGPLKAGEMVDIILTKEMEVV
ncbi:MAG: molybdopterin molybdenumtransferase MoeA, partial [Bacillota bacterium]|nr:molybdopterin molybdenumtransferase MoeA [Bacillota bacterium]